VAAHNRATLPVFGGISGSTRTTFIQKFQVPNSNFQKNSPNKNFK